MSLYKKVKTDGISLRTVYGWLIVLAVLVSGLLIYATYHSSSTFLHLSEATDEYIELQKAAYELMDASDYLTENVQRFTVSGERTYMDLYFQEAFESRRREDAIEKMSRNPNSTAALERLQLAMDESQSLMDREYYAMRLVIEATGITSYPDVLDTVTLSEPDQALPAAEKMALARNMVLDKTYYNQKERIRKNMRDSLAELEYLTHGMQTDSTIELRSELRLVRVIIVVQAIGIMLTIWLTAQLGINPILKAVDRIKDDSTIPVTGANEFRYLAKTYNKMYEVYKRSVSHLNYKASHDELTKLYNRSGYDLLLSSLDMDSTFMLLFDVDNFKDVNDSYGHEMGDKVLQKVAEVVRHNFRSDDYVCRIGGDEFVVLLVHADLTQNLLIRSKILQINQELSDTEDGLPAVTISVGVAHGETANSTAELFGHADEALYVTKHRARGGFTFYEEMKAVRAARS